MAAPEIAFADLSDNASLAQRLLKWGIDLQSEHERYLTEKYAKKPVIVMNYPQAIKAFYMRVNDDGRTVAAMDVLAPGIGEIIGGRPREERLEVLDRSMAERGSGVGAAVFGQISPAIRASSSPALTMRVGP